MTSLPQSLRMSDDDVAALVSYREHLHRHPELSMQEYKTAEYLEEFFGSMDLAQGMEREVFRCGGTGVVLVLRNGKGPVVGFRADTDGLPIKEDTDLPFASTDTTELDGRQVPLMHGCGHDVHTACAMTAAQLLARDGSQWAGTVVFLLQPGEETAAGAKAMTADGLWDKAPVPEVLFGQHVFPTPRGTVTLVPGDMLTAGDSVRVTVHGKGAHGSQPHLSVDPVVLGAAMVTRIQTIVSREVDPFDPVVVTTGTFHAGLKENVIPDSAEFTLNIRTFGTAVRNKVIAAVKRIVAGEAAAAGAPEPTVEIMYSFPPTHNTDELSEQMREIFEAELGAENVLYEPDTRYMGSEDFSELATSANIPYHFWIYGGYSEEQRKDPENLAGNHSPFFAPTNEFTLETGVRAALAAIVSRVGTAS